MTNREPKYDDEQKEAMRQAFLAGHASALYRGQTYYQMDTGTLRAAERTFDNWHGINYDD